MRLDAKLVVACALLRRAVQIIGAAADAGNVQCKEGIKELNALCHPKKSSTSSEPAT